MLTETLTAGEKGRSPFEQAIRRLETPACSIFIEDGRVVPVSFSETEIELSTADSQRVAATFPQTGGNNRVLAGEAINPNPPTGLRVAVLFSGGPASGGHNVLVGLSRVLGPKNTLLGVKAGPKGLIAGDLFEIKPQQVEDIFNTGGFDFLGTDRTKIKSDEQFAAVRRTCQDNKLDGLVVIGGDDSNTNAAVLAELLSQDGVKVIGVPKTIDGDLQQGSLLPISFGFDTATKIYAEMVGNILQDTPSSRKYWHFVRVMGRSASHVALEVALQTRAAIALISEEIAAKEMPLMDIIDQIAHTVVARAHKGINHGMVLIPEGVIEFIPQMKGLIAELNECLVTYADQMEKLSMAHKRDFVVQRISAVHAQIFASLPDEIEEQLLLERDSHGNLQVTQIPTEKLLIEMTTDRVQELDPEVSFSTQNHFFGYEGRCGAPSLFDAAYTYNLGLIAGSLIADGRTGYICALSDLENGGRPLALPLAALLNIERRHGKDEMVIEKALVEIDSPAFAYFAERRDDWAEEDRFSSPGPRQLWGPTSRQMPITVALNQGYKDLKFQIGS